MPLSSRIAFKKILFCFCLSLLGEDRGRGGEEWGLDAPAVLSSAGTAAVHIGGEMRFDYAYRHTRIDNPAYRLVGSHGDLLARNVNLRLAATVAPNIHASFKLNLSDSGGSIDEEILAEALLVMTAVGGTGLEVFVGQGRAPYGQDITLGMIQSYNHTANRASTPEGDVFIMSPPNDARAPGAWRHDEHILPPMRPGQFDRALLAGIAYGARDDAWRAELALFQPAADEYAARLAGRGTGSDIGLAARVWWRPLERLVLEASGVLTHSGAMGRAWLRNDIPSGADARSYGGAASVGFDWRSEEWRVFGEYQHGWNWNFTAGYSTDTAQLGAARIFAEHWRVGGMIETMRIEAEPGADYLDNYYKATLGLRRDFLPGVFALLELGGEWYTRSHPLAGRETRRGIFTGFRLGLTF